MPPCLPVCGWLSDCLFASLGHVLGWEGGLGACWQRQCPASCHHAPALSWPAFALAALQISPLSRWLIYLVPPTLFFLNVVWFFKILKGAIKLFVKPPPKAGVAAADAVAEAPGGPAEKARKER